MEQASPGEIYNAQARVHGWAGFCDPTGLTHSLDLEGTTFIQSLTSLARARRSSTC